MMSTIDAEDVRFILLAVTPMQHYNITNLFERIAIESRDHLRETNEIELVPTLRQHGLFLQASKCIGSTQPSDCYRSPCEKLVMLSDVG